MLLWPCYSGHVHISIIATYMQLLAKQLSVAPGRLVAIKCDVRKEEEVITMFDEIKTKFGGIDLCINNAGLAHDASLLTGATHEWRDMMEVCVVHYAFSQSHDAKWVT